MRRWAFGCLMLVVGMSLGLLLALLVIYWATVQYTSPTPMPTATTAPMTTAPHR